MARVEAGGQGTWRQVAVVIDGRRIPVGPGALLTADAEGFTVTVNGRRYARGTARTDLSREPHESDVQTTEGPNVGTIVRQIFLIRGDVLIVCAAAPGAPRPVDFTSRPGSGHTLSVWLRADAAEAARAVTPVQDWRFWLFIVAILAVANQAGELRHDLAEHLGYGAALAISVVIVAVLGALAGLALRWGWRAATSLGVTMSVAIHTFEEVRRAVEPALGSLGAIAVSACTAGVVALAGSAVLARLLRWGPSPP